MPGWDGTVEWARLGQANGGQGRASGAVSGRVLGGSGWLGVVFGRFSGGPSCYCRAGQLPIMSTAQINGFSSLCHSKRQQTNALIDRMVDG